VINDKLPSKAQSGRLDKTETKMETRMWQKAAW